MRLLNIDFLRNNLQRIELRMYRQQLNKNNSSKSNIYKTLQIL